MGLALPAREQRLAEAAEQTLRARLGEERFVDLLGRGSTMTLEKAVEFATSRRDPPTG